MKAHSEWLCCSSYEDEDDVFDSLWAVCCTTVSNTDVTDSTLTWLYRNQYDPAFTRLTFRTQTGNYLFITALWRQLCLSLFSLIVTLQIVFTFRQHTSASLSLKRLSHAAQTQATDITVSFYCYIIVIKRIWCIWIYLFVCGVIISIINILNLFCLLYFLF